MFSFNTETDSNDNILVKSHKMGSREGRVPLPWWGREAVTQVFKYRNIKCGNNENTRFLHGKSPGSKGTKTMTHPGKIFRQASLTQSAEFKLQNPCNPRLNYKAWCHQSLDRHTPLKSSLTWNVQFFASRTCKDTPVVSLHLVCMTQQLFLSLGTYKDFTTVLFTRTSATL